MKICLMITIAYLQKQIIEKISEEEMVKETGSVHFLSHRPVVRTSEEMIKIRAVFDVSYSYDGPSLNKCLYPGPNLPVKIFDIFVRFRLNPIRIISGIKQTSLNVQVSGEHKNLLRFTRKIYSPEKIFC